MTLAVSARGRCHGSPSTTSRAASAALRLRHIRGRQLMLRPVTSAAARFTVARPTKTPLCGSRKACRSSSCQLPFPAQEIDIRSSFTARLPQQNQRAPSTARAALAPLRSDHSGCTGLFSRSFSGSAHQLLSLSRASCRRDFSTSYPTMAATKLDGTAIAKKIRERLAAEIVEKQKSNPKYKPCLKIIQGLNLTAMFSHDF